MKHRTKNQLTALVIVSLIVVIAVWYTVTRPVYFQNASLIQIDYAPTTDAPPYLTFTFSTPLAPMQVVGTTAVLKNFTVGNSSPTDAATAAPLLALLTGDPLTFGGPSPGPTPFVPEYSPASPSTLATNTLPAGGCWSPKQACPAGAAVFAQPMTITGNGLMWFAVPKQK
jgi:hypothetical protein